MRQLDIGADCVWNSEVDVEEESDSDSDTDSWTSDSEYLASHHIRPSGKRQRYNVGTPKTYDNEAPRYPPKYTPKRTTTN